MEKAITLNYLVTGLDKVNLSHKLNSNYKFKTENFLSVLYYYFTKETKLKHCFSISI